MLVEQSFKNIIIKNIIKSSKDVGEFLNNNRELNHVIKRAEESWIRNDIKLTVAIMTFNEERCIERCIESVLSISDEIIIVDSGSTDNTVKIIKDKFPGVVLYSQPWQNDFSLVRNKMIELSKYNWIFQIDADEYLNKDNCEEIKKVIHFLEHCPIENVIISPILIDHDLSETLHTKRIFKKTEDVRYFGIVHEELRIDNSAEIPYIIIRSNIFHDGYKEEVISLKNKYHRNFLLLEKMIEKEPNNARWYYFLAREAFALQLPREYIISVLEEALKISKHDSQDYHTGIYSLLMELNLENRERVENFALEAKKNNVNLMDVYFFEFLSFQIDINNEFSNKIKENIVEIRGLDNPFSLINSNGDHIFHAWGWAYFQNKKYELAFNMWEKICSEEIKCKVMGELGELNNCISKFLKNYS